MKNYPGGQRVKASRIKYYDKLLVVLFVSFLEVATL